MFLRHYRFGRVRLVVGAFDRKHPLTVDPILSYSKFLGGTGSDQPNGIAVDSSHYAYLTGQTTSTDFPVTSGAERYGSDVFVTKLSPDGSSASIPPFSAGTPMTLETRLRWIVTGTLYGEGCSSNSRGHSVDLPHAVK